MLYVIYIYIVACFVFQCSYGFSASISFSIGWLIGWMSQPTWTLRLLKIYSMNCNLALLCMISHLTI